MVYVVRRMIIAALVVLIVLLLYRLRTHPPRAVLVIGDSIVQSWDTEPLQMENAGASGDISLNVLYRYLSTENPGSHKIVVVLVGVNDILDAVPEATYEENITELASAVQHNGERLVLCSLLPIGEQAATPDYLTRIPEMNRFLRSFADANGYVYVNFYDAMLGSNGYAMPDLLSDGVHPSAAGYAVMNRVLNGAINAL